MTRSETVLRACRIARLCWHMIWSTTRRCSPGRAWPTIGVVKVFRESNPPFVVEFWSRLQDKVEAYQYEAVENKEL
ncbi:hypothetical protein J3F84DRAFT_376838 [Trichoderma pleuroticola]